MTLNRIVKLLICLVFTQNSFAQTKWLDSAIAVYHAQTKIDTANFNLLYKITLNLGNVAPAKALAYSDTALELAKQIKLPLLLANAYSLKVTILSMQGKFDEVINYSLAGLQIIKNKNDQGALKLKSQFFYSIGRSLRRQNKFDKALEAFEKSLDIGYQLQDSSMLLNNYNSIGTIYMGIADWQTALGYMQKGKLLSENSKKLKRQYTAFLINMGNIFLVLKRYDESLKTLKTAFLVSDSIHDELEHIFTCGVLSDLYHKLKDYNNCYKMAMVSYLVDKRTNNVPDMSQDYKNLGRVFRDAPDSMLISWNVPTTKRYDTAENLLKKAIDIADNQKSFVLKEDPMEDIAYLYEKMGNYQKAYEYFKGFKFIHDSLGSNSQQKSILLNDIQYRFGRQTDSLKFSQAVQQSKLQQELVANQQNILLANKDKELQHLVFLKTQADLQNTSIENNKNQKKFFLVKKEKELQAVQVSQLAKDKQYAAQQLQQQTAYTILAIVIPFLFIILFFSYTRLRRKRLEASIAKEKAEQQLKEADFKNRMNDITLKALRNQMNPHFIFNCLNSIKLYTMENDTVAASNYIGKFATLIRNMLDNSRRDRITLASEIESINLYIELEAMRFKNKLRYSINVDRNLDIDFIELPPLLVQPYIENAIWHGLMPKTDGGSISVNISQKTNQNILVIEIIDDGVGREAANEINNKKKTYHQSMGIKVTGERIALINEKYKAEANITITDLYNNNSQPVGTQVTIQLPLE